MNKWQAHPHNTLHNLVFDRDKQPNLFGNNIIYEDKYVLQHFVNVTNIFT